ncbi:MAG: hypothetical protein GC162_02340 [Planctomycetes bacterium]|nr:hypothetical protein [Planctomycetota bacterium]
MVCDVNGLTIGKGDTVAPITGDFKGKVCAIKQEEGMGFVCIRAAHRPYSKGIWYASEHVQRLQVAKVRDGEDPKSSKAKPARASAKHGRSAATSRR